MLFIDPKAYRLPFVIFKWLNSFIKNIPIPVQGNAPYQKDLSNFNNNKLIIFSHGLGAHLNCYTGCCANWASNGHTVITINHVHDDISIEKKAASDRD